MTKYTAERRSIAVHNAKCFLVSAKQFNLQQCDPDDEDAIKLQKDLTSAIGLIRSIEYDLDKIIENPKPQKKK